METFFTLTLDLPSGSIDFPLREQKHVEELGKTILISLNVQKEMYTPGYIEAVFHIESQGNISSIDTLDFKTLLGCSVDLNDGARNLAKDYVVFDYVPEYKPSQNGTSLYLKLNIFSPEHVFSFQKYNKCYVAKKLGADILKSVASQSDLVKSTNIEHLQHTLIRNEANDSWMEFIQPYLVQYEETPLDLLRRVANRCGEFLFYEDGTWQLGFNPTPAIEIKNFSTLSFKKPKDKDVENFFMTNYMKTTDEQEQPEKDKNTRRYSGPNEEYLDTLTKSKSSFVTAFGNSFAIDDPGSYLYNACQWMKKDNLYEIVTSLAADVTKNSLKTITKLNEKQDNWNDVFIKPYEENIEQCTTDGGVVVCPLSNYNAHKYFGKDFYVKTRELEQKAAEQAIHIDFGIYYEPLLLGDIITVLGKTYIVVKISATCVHKNAVGSMGTYTTFEVDAVPVLDAGYYPPLLEESPSPSIANQVAYVIANNDPSELGRIQFRYPWQSEEAGCPSSPWVRTTQPFASKDSGIRFTPQVGDEIMIGYEFGNIERPFVMGAMTSATNTFKVGQNRAAFLENSIANSYVDSGLDGFCNNDFMIKSPTGQYIKFLSPTNQNCANFATSFFPALNAWLKYIPMSGDAITYSGDSAKQLSGGINIGDAYGFFNINMSTEKRKILISSPLGDVNIDAMTGITISAPNGDVKITGRNVDIVAGNNLTLMSGANIPKMRKAYTKNTGYAAKDAAFGIILNEVKSLTTLFDLRLLRSVIDAFVKPIGGTALIKSNRFLCMEAGKGKTKLPDKAYKTASFATKGDVDYKLLDLKVKDILRSTSIMAKRILTMYKAIHAKVQEAKQQYESCIDRRIRLWGSYNYLNGITQLKFNKQEVTIREAQEKIETAADIITAALDPNKEVADTHKKMDKLTAKKTHGTNVFDRDKLMMQKAAEALAKTVKEYLILTNRGRINLIAEDSITISNANFVSNHGDLAAYRADILRLITPGYESIQWLRTGEDLGNPEQRDFTDKEHRKILYAVIQKLKEEKYIDIYIPYLVAAHQLRNCTKDDISVCENNASWSSYLSCIRHYADGRNLESDFSQLFGAMYSHWEENRVWDAEIKGEILLSDSSGNTCNINGESIRSTAVSNISKELKELGKI